MLRSESSRQLGASSSELPPLRASENLSGVLFTYASARTTQSKYPDVLGGYRFGSQTAVGKHGKLLDAEIVLLEPGNYAG